MNYTTQQTMLHGKFRGGGGKEKEITTKMKSFKERKFQREKEFVLLVKPNFF